MMTKESKLALIMSFVLILVVGVLISDHFSHAGSADLGVVEPEVRTPSASLPDGSDGSDDSVDPSMSARSMLETMVESIDTIRAPELAQTAPSTVDPAPQRSGYQTEQIGDQPVMIMNAPSESRVTNSDAATCKVREGDSLYAIARRELNNGERWREILRLNTDTLSDPSELRAGMTLKLPDDARSASVTRSTTQPRVSTPAQTSTSGTLRSHVVASGEILGVISQKYLGTVKRMDEIVELNGLRDADDIRVGMTLKIPAR